MYDRVLLSLRVTSQVQNRELYFKSAVAFHSATTHIVTETVSQRARLAQTWLHTPPLPLPHPPPHSPHSKQDRTWWLCPFLVLRPVHTGRDPFSVTLPFTPVATGACDVMWSATLLRLVVEWRTTHSLGVKRPLPWGRWAAHSTTAFCIDHSSTCYFGSSVWLVETGNSILEKDGWIGSGWSSSQCLCSNVCLGGDTGIWISSESRFKPQGHIV